MKKHVVYQKSHKCCLPHKDNKTYIEYIASTQKEAEEYVSTALQLALRDCDYKTVKKDFKIKHQEVYRKYMIVHYDKNGGLVGYYGGHAVHMLSEKLMPMWYDKNDSWSWKYYDKADAKKDVEALRKEVCGPVKLVKLPRKEWIEYEEVN